MDLKQLEHGKNAAAKVAKLELTFAQIKEAQHNFAITSSDNAVLEAWRRMTPEQQKTVLPLLVSLVAENLNNAQKAFAAL